MKPPSSPRNERLSGGACSGFSSTPTAWTRIRNRNPRPTESRLIACFWIAQTTFAPLIKKIAAALRTSVKTAHEGFLQRLTQEKSRLEAADAWKGLTSAQRQSLTQQFGLDEIPAVSVGSDDELLTTLDRTPLGSWRDKTDALSSRFAQALAAASKLLEPMVQTVRLTSGTLKTNTDVRQWLSHQETVLLAKLSDGPIVIQ